MIFDVSILLTLFEFIVLSLLKKEKIYMLAQSFNSSGKFMLKLETRKNEINTKMIGQRAKKNFSFLFILFCIFWIGNSFINPVSLLFGYFFSLSISVLFLLNLFFLFRSWFVHFFQLPIFFLLLIQSMIDFLDVHSFFTVISSSLITIVLKEDLVVLFIIVHGLKGAW